MTQLVMSRFHVASPLTRRHFTVASAWTDALAARAALAKTLAQGRARVAPAFVCEATTFGGPHDVGTGSSGYRGEDLRKWVYPDPYGCAELSTNYTAPLADLDYRALMMELPTDA